MRTILRTDCNHIWHLAMAEVWTFLRLASVFEGSSESLVSHCDRTSVEVLEQKAPPLGNEFPPRLLLGLVILRLNNQIILSEVMRFHCFTFPMFSDLCCLTHTHTCCWTGAVGDGVIVSIIRHVLYRLLRYDRSDLSNCTCIPAPPHWIQRTPVPTGTPVIKMTMY